LEWVSHLWENVTAVFVDLKRFPHWQVFSLQQASADLQGFQGAAEFDFVNSRFRSNIRKSSRDKTLCNFAQVAVG
jgi:hypothetical protein